MSFDVPPLVSVIIPVYNGSNFLREAINSVVSQTYSNFEIIVVDDGSTDDSWKIIQSYGNKIRGIHKDNGGVASALNCGIRTMNGSYFAWLSHDDLWLPDKIEKQIRFFEENPECQISYTDYYVIDLEGIITGTVVTPWYPRQRAKRELFQGGFINGSSIMIKKTCFDSVGLFSENLRYTQDTEMWIRMSRKFEIGHVPEILIKQRMHRDQGSRSNIPVFLSEINSMYLNMFYSMNIDDLLPEFKDLVPVKKKARALVWFGDNISENRNQFDFAAEQYRKSLEIDPSLSNIARTHAVANWVRKFTYMVVTKIKHVFNRRTADN